MNYFKGWLSFLALRFALIELKIKLGSGAIVLRTIAPDPFIVNLPPLLTRRELLLK